MGRRMNKHFSKEDAQIANKHTNTEHKLNITNHGKMQTKPTVKHSLTPVRVTQQKDTK